MCISYYYVYVPMSYMIYSYPLQGTGPKPNQGQWKTGLAPLLLPLLICYIFGKEIIFFLLFFLKSFLLFLMTTYIFISYSEAEYYSVYFVQCLKQEIITVINVLSLDEWSITNILWHTTSLRSSKL